LSSAAERAERFAPHLQPDEAVRWSGRPRQGLAWRGDDASKVPFSVLWLAFVLIWLWVARSWNAGPLFIVPGTAFALVGVYFVFGRFFADAIDRAHTRYALTDQRALILRGRRLTSVELQDVSRVHFQPNGGDRGTNVFGPLPRGVMLDYQEALKPRSPEFFQTNDAAAAYALIRRSRNEV
jgi:hypothetical protein